MAGYNKERFIKQKMDSGLYVMGPDGMPVRKGAGGKSKAAPAGGQKAGTDHTKTASTGGGKAKRKGGSPFKLPQTAPIPTPRSTGSPDLAVSPMRPDNLQGNMSAGAPTSNPPPNFPPDLAVSPFRSDNAMGNMSAGAPGAVPPPSFVLPPNASMFQGSVLQTVPPDLRGLPPVAGMSSPDDALRQLAAQQAAARQTAASQPVSGLLGGQKLFDRSPYKLW